MWEYRFWLKYGFWIQIAFACLRLWAIGVKSAALRSCRMGDLSLFAVMTERLVRRAEARLRATRST